MAVRTTEALVKDVLQDDFGPLRSGDDPSLDPYITAANQLINRLARVAAEDPDGYQPTLGELTNLETWVAAHNYTVMDQKEQSRSNSGASSSFQGQTGMYLEATRYGQTAISMDPTGLLRALAKNNVAGGQWLGKPESQQLSWQERN